MSPRVTVGVTTYNRTRFLEEAIASLHAQTYRDFEILVVDDGSSDDTAEVARRLVGDRGRVIVHPENRGVCAAHNTIMREFRGDLLGWLDDDDAAQPDWLERAVAALDANPGAGLAHGDAVVVDAAGKVLGEWAWTPWAPYVDQYEGYAVADGRAAAVRGRLPLVRQLVREANMIIAPGTVARRSLCEAVGEHDAAIPRAHDMDWWLRALDHCDFQHVAGGPLVRYRRHGANASGEANRDEEVRDVTAVLRRTIARHDIAALVPELDWGALDPGWARRRAHQTLARDLRQRGLEQLATEQEAQAATFAATPRARRRPDGAPSRIVLTSFGFNEPGGGTRVPRILAKELVRRGWEVTVFHAGLGATFKGDPFIAREWEADGVRLVGIYNRPTGMLDLGEPGREIDTPAVTAAWARVLDGARPDVVHFHNLHNLGSALVDETFARGVRTLFTTHNHWLVCPRSLLFRESHTALCQGPADEGRACARCVGSSDVATHARRRSVIRGRFNARVDAVLAVSDAVRRTLVSSGFDPELVEVVEQAMPEPEAIWEAVGRDRRPGRGDGPLRVALFGSLYPHKGPDLLVRAAQLVEAPLEIQLHGDVREEYRRHLESLDERGIVRFPGGFTPEELPGLLRDVDVAAVPSATWDCAPLVAAECLAGRVPLVGSRMGGVPEAIREGVDGLLFDGLDVGGLAACLRRLATEPGLLERLQEQIRPPRSFATFVDDLEGRYTGARPARDDARRGPIAVRWTGDVHVSSSLAMINRTVTAQLRSMPDIRVERWAPAEGVLDAPLPHVADVEVRHQWPPDLTDPGASRLVLIQPWEFGSVPSAWIDDLSTTVDELWVPSEFVRQMYVRDGVPAERVAVVPNGVDLERFVPVGPDRPFATTPAVRFLFVGGTIYRKGVDLLIDAYQEAFAGRDDVELVIKDLGGATFYKGKTAGSQLADLAASGRLPRVVYLDDDLADDELPALYRACDVLVHPYRGEGFAMPVLEAMACGLPTIVTAGGPTDEFCPPAAGWRVAATRQAVAWERIQIETVREPWMLEPDPTSLVAALRAAADDPTGRASRAAAAVRAAAGYGWDAVAERYAERLRAVADRPPVRHAAAATEPFLLPDARARNLLATPAWQGSDELGALLAAWAAAFRAADDVALVLLADPADCDEEADIERRVLDAAAASGVELDESVADIIVLRHACTGDDLARIHLACDGYVPIHAGCEGNARIARRCGRPVLAPTATALRAWVAVPRATAA